MQINDQEQRIIKELGVENIPEEDQKILLKLLDERLEKRFMANLLLSLTEDKRNELSQKIESMGELKPEEVIEMVIGLHPDARGVLEKSTLEIIDEMKQDGKIASSQPFDRAQDGQSASSDTKPDAINKTDDMVDKTQETDYYQPVATPPTASAQDLVSDQPNSASTSPPDAPLSNPPLESADNKE